MPLTFLNGGAPDYLGFSFTDSTTLLTQIHTTLTDAGLTSIVNTPGSNLITLRFNATENSDTCFIKFETALVSTVLELRVTMGETSGFAPSSPIHKCFATNGQQNRLWITANQDHLVLCIQDFTGLCYGIHAGYLLRLDASDTFAYAIGVPSSSAYKSDQFRNQLPASHRYNYTVGKGFHTGTVNWLAPATQFRLNNQDAGGAFPDVGNGPYFGCGFMNRHANCILPYDASDTVSNRNAGENNHIGNVNALNGKTVLGEYYAVEGHDTSQTSYGVVGDELMAFKPYFRGVVQNVVVGMSHLLDGVQIEDTTGRRYLSTGGLSYQGMRIV